MNSYDLATGLLNRNRYLQYIEHFSDQYTFGLGCIYLDVNGLHEYNNTYGHANGDMLLAGVARILKKNFGEHLIFRTGGDEFVIIIKNLLQDTMQEKLLQMEQDLAATDINVAYGFEFRNSNFDIEDMLKAADGKMYRHKSRFYREKRRRKRESAPSFPVDQ